MYKSLYVTLISKHLRVLVSRLKLPPSAAGPPKVTVSVVATRLRRVRSNSRSSSSWQVVVVVVVATVVVVVEGGRISW